MNDPYPKFCPRCDGVWAQEYISDRQCVRGHWYHVCLRHQYLVPGRGTHNHLEMSQLNRCTCPKDRLLFFQSRKMVMTSLIDHARFDLATYIQAEVKARAMQEFAKSAIPLAQLRIVESNEVRDGSAIYACRVIAEDLSIPNC